MRDVTYSMSMSLDAYISGPDGDFNWSEPDPEVFELATDEVRRAGVHLLGRHLYEAMLFWESAADRRLTPAQQEFADLWNALPKIVFSTTLTSVTGPGARLATAGLADEVARLRAEPGDSDIAIGGPRLASHAADLGLIDEYRIRVYPVLVGGGSPYFAQHQRLVRLEPVESRALASGILYLRYRTGRG
ncbi:dihydrofolate reductase family protein [Jannaschia sp. R86511]|uniref:dihydrofolate reductase family protein n=1 Tax=Jannaschia sp. R86511 TaxID=3093853 RepID=UPI0036D2E477